MAEKRTQRLKYRLFLLKFRGQNYADCNKKFLWQHNFPILFAQQIFVPCKQASTLSLYHSSQGVFYEKCYLFCVSHAGVCLVGQRIRCLAALAMHRERSIRC